MNVEGANDAGFAGLVAERFWLELATLRNNYPPHPKPGEVLVHEAKGYTFYALVCHSLGRDGWKETPKALDRCFDHKCFDAVPREETIACVLVGGGPIGQMGGADVLMNMGSIARAKHKFSVWTL